MIKAMIFDLDDTLYDYGPLHNEAIKDLAEYASKRYSIEKERFCSAWDMAREETKRTQGNTAASHDRMLYCQKTLEKLGLPPAEGTLELYDIYWGHILDHMVLRKGAVELLEACRDRGVKVGICSDLTAHIQHRKLKALGIASKIDCIVTSEEAGVEKPDPKIFQIILKKLDCTPGEVLYLGDDLIRDVHGAEACGIPVIWMQRGGQNNAAEDFVEVRERLKWD